MRTSTGAPVEPIADCERDWEARSRTAAEGPIWGELRGFDFFGEFRGLLDFFRPRGHVESDPSQHTVPSAPIFFEIRALGTAVFHPPFVCAFRCSSHPLFLGVCVCCMGVFVLCVCLQHVSLKFCSSYYIYIYTYLLLFLFLLAGRAAQRTNPRGPVPTPRGATPRGATKTPELRTPRPWRTLRRREPQGPRMRGPWTASTPWTQECPTTTTQRTSCRPSCPTSS